MQGLSHVKMIVCEASMYIWKEGEGATSLTILQSGTKRIDACTFWGMAQSDYLFLLTSLASSSHCPVLYRSHDPLSDQSGR